MYIQGYSESYSLSYPVNWSARSHGRNGRCEARIEPRLDLSRHPCFEFAQRQPALGVSWCGRTTKADFAAPHDLVDHPAKFFFLGAGLGPPCAFITFDTRGLRLTGASWESRLYGVVVLPEVGEGGEPRPKSVVTQGCIASSRIPSRCR
jgi:hypothetical protein